MDVADVEPSLMDVFPSIETGSDGLSTMPDLTDGSSNSQMEGSHSDSGPSADDDARVPDPIGITPEDASLDPNSQQEDSASTEVPPGVNPTVVAPEEANSPEPEQLATKEQAVDDGSTELATFAKLIAIAPADEGSKVDDEEAENELQTGDANGVSTSESVCTDVVSPVASPQNDTDCASSSPVNIVPASPGHNSHSQSPHNESPADHTSNASSPVSNQPIDITPDSRSNSPCVIAPASNTCPASPVEHPSRSISPVTFSLEPDDDLLPDNLQSSVSSITDLIGGEAQGEKIKVTTTVTALPGINSTAISFPNLSSIVSSKTTGASQPGQQIKAGTTVINLAGTYRHVRKPTILRKPNPPNTADRVAYQPTQVFLIGASGKATPTLTPVVTAPTSPAVVPTPMQVVPASVSSEPIPVPTDTPSSREASASPKPVKNTNHDPDEANVITIEPVDMDSDDDACTIIDPEVARRVPPPPATSHPQPTPATQNGNSDSPLRIQNVLSLSDSTSPFVSNSVLLSQVAVNQEHVASAFSPLQNAVAIAPRGEVYISSADGTGPTSVIPVTGSATVNKQKETLPVNVASIELKNKNTIFGLMMILMTPAGTKREFFCNFCLTKSTEEKVFMDHVASHLFVCGGCSYQSFARVDVVRHILKFHPESQNDLAKLHTMHLENVTLKPQGQSFVVGSGKNSEGNKSWSNVLSGNYIYAAPRIRGSKAPAKAPPNKTPATPKASAVTKPPVSVSTQPAVKQPNLAFPAVRGIAPKPPLVPPSLAQNIAGQPLNSLVKNVKAMAEENNLIPKPDLTILKKTDGSRLGITVLEKSGRPVEDIFYVKVPGRASNSDRSILVNGKSHKVVMYQCGKCRFRDQDDQVVRMHQKAHMFSKLTVILSAYGVVCPYCLIVHKTMPFMYEHLEQMHKEKPVAFFLMMRCMGANDMYWFCPCCSVVKSDKQKHVIWQHVMAGHLNDFKFSQLYIQYRHNDAAEKFLIDLWVNGFVLKSATTCTAVVPQKDNAVILQGEAGDTDNAVKGDADSGKVAEEEATVEDKDDEDGGEDEAVPMDTEQILKGCGYAAPAKLTKHDLDGRNLPTAAWLRANYPGSSLRQNMSKKDRVLTIDAVQVPPECVPMNFKDYFVINEGVPECKLCGKPFLTTSQHSKRPLNHVEEHVFCHFDISVWVCPFCRKRRKRRGDVLTHIRTTHFKVPLIVIRDTSYVTKSTQARSISGAPINLNASYSPRYSHSTEKTETKPAVTYQPFFHHEYVYSCFFCPRQTQTQRIMLDHVKYVHPDKPYSRSMYQKFLAFEPDLVGEQEKIEKGLLKAAVSVVRVEDMEEYEHHRKLLASVEEASGIDSGKALLPKSKPSGKYECEHCGYRALKLDVTRRHLLQQHPDLELVIRDHVAAVGFGSAKHKQKGRLLYCCPSCSFYSNKREAILVHAGRNPSHFSCISGSLDLEEAKKLAENQSTHSLRERKVKMEEDELEQLPIPRKKKKRTSGGIPVVRPMDVIENVRPKVTDVSKEVAAKASRSVARKSTGKPQFSAIAAALAVAPDDRPALTCSLCSVIERNVTYMKHHYRQSHPECAIIAVNEATKTRVYICPQSSCLFHEEEPFLVENHLILSHDGDKDGQRTWYSPAKIAFQQIRHAASGSSWLAKPVGELHNEGHGNDTAHDSEKTTHENKEPVVPQEINADDSSDTLSANLDFETEGQPTDDVVEGGVKPSTVQEESGDKHKSHNEEISLNEDSMDTSAGNGNSSDEEEVPMSSNDLSSESSSDDRDGDPDFNTRRRRSVGEPKKKRSRKRKSSGTLKRMPLQSPTMTTKSPPVPYRGAMDATEKRYKCRYCSFECEEVWAGRDHLITHHPHSCRQEIKDVKLSRQRQKSRLHFCRLQKCDFMSYNPVEYHSHNCDGGEMKCVECGFVTDDGTILHNHIKQLHVKKMSGGKQGPLRLNIPQLDDEDDEDPEIAVLPVPDGYSQESLGQEDSDSDTIIDETEQNERTNVDPTPGVYVDYDI